MSKKPAWLVAMMLKKAGVPCAEQIAMMLAKCKKNSDKPATAAQYLYGTPSESGNIGLRVGESVTYYDGAVLPELPEWDKTEYPYAFIKAAPESVVSANAILYCTKTPWQFDFSQTTKNYLYYLGESYGKYSAFRIFYGGVKWDSYATDRQLPQSGIYGNGSDTFEEVHPRWSNFDMLNYDDGTVFIHASDPIPVGGIGDYINDIPIYEVIT